MDKITQALQKVLPADQVAEVAQAIEAVMAEHYSRLENDFHAKLESAYEKLTEEKQADELIAETGYQQAYEIIHSLMGRLEEQRVAFQKTLDEGFEDAYQELEKERAKNGNLEVELYEEFDGKLQEMKTIMVDKLDKFMTVQEAEMLEKAKQHVMNDPRLLEQRVIVEKMAALLADYISNDATNSISSSKLEESHKQVEALRGQVRLLESKNVKLSVQNNRLTEQVSEANNIITEATKLERKERVNRKGNVSGRGHRVTKEQQSLIKEYVAPVANQEEELTEQADPLHDILVLSGIESGEF